MFYKYDIIFKKYNKIINNIIDYKKYENVTPKELFYAFNKAEKKVIKIEQELKEYKELVKFLKTKIKKSLSNKKESKKINPYKKY